MTTILFSGIPFELTHSTQKLHDALVADVEKHNEEAEMVERQAAGLREILAEDWSTTDEQIAARVREKTCDLMGQEIEIRKRIGDFYETVQSLDFQAARASADQAYDAAMAEVRKGLLALGYVEGLIPGADQNSIIPDMYWRHPRIFKIRSGRDALLSFDLTAHRQGNQAAIGQAKAKLAEAKQKATVDL